MITTCKCFCERKGEVNEVKTCPTFYDELQSTCVMYHNDFLSSISNCDETQNRKCMFHRNVAQLISLSLLVHAHGLTLKLTLSLVFVMIFLVVF